jgi:hypothetical protein
MNGNPSAGRSRKTALLGGLLGPLAFLTFPAPVHAKAPGMALSSRHHPRGAGAAASKRSEVCSLRSLL